MNAVLTVGNVPGRATGLAGQTVRQSFVVKLEHGLHARPCAMLVQAVQPFRGTVEVEVNGETASGKSILGLMSLAAGCGSKITFSIKGENAHQTMANLERIFDSNFGMRVSQPVLQHRAVKA